MVRVILTRAQGENHLMVSGHADAGPYGADLVCAAVSALVETWRLGIEQGHAGTTQCRVETGRAEFWWNAASQPRAEAVAQTMTAGFRDLATSHRRFLQFEERAAKE
ncbi:MAG: ribosomal-processing cysteine protease Prp [Thermaerobacter sp.]|nr:ribosomal-processing cysteine protease Prp [Thermaerobacter sp.]